MKEWLFSKKKKNKYKKQQLLKALKLSYISRKRKLKIKKIFPLLLGNNDGSNKRIAIKLTKFNINWLLKKSV